MKVEFFKNRLKFHIKDCHWLLEDLEKAETKKEIEKLLKYQTLETITRMAIERGFKNEN